MPYYQTPGETIEEGKETIRCPFVVMRLSIRRFGEDYNHKVRAIILEITSFAVVVLKLNVQNYEKYSHRVFYIS